MNYVHSTNNTFTVLEHRVKTVYLHLNYNAGYVNVKYCDSLAGLIRTCLSEINAVVNNRSMSERAPCANDRIKNLVFQK